MALRILVVEDDDESARFVDRALTEAGHIVDRTGSGKDGLAMAMSEDYDVVILDRMLPGVDGLSIAKSHDPGLLYKRRLEKIRKFHQIRGQSSRELRKHYKNFVRERRAERKCMIDPTSRIAHHKGKRDGTFLPKM